jgi:hypothetical protein
MVFLAITPNGLNEALKLSVNREIDVWCGADAIPETEYNSLQGVSISRFVYTLSNESSEVLADAISTIEEHHPNETVWVEHVCQS